MDVIYKTLIRYVLNDFESSDILEKYVLDKTSFLEFLFNIKYMMDFDKPYFLVNKRAISKTLDVIAKYRFRDDMKDFYSYINSLIIELNSINNIKDKNKSIKLYSEYELNTRFLNKGYTNTFITNNNIDNLCYGIKTLQDFDYGYIGLLKHDQYDLITKDNFTEFLGSTNYFLSTSPKLFEKEDLLKIKDTIKRVDSNYESKLAKKTLRNIKNL